MGVTRLKRKDRKNKTRANNRKAKIQWLNTKPVIKQVDIEEAKKGFEEASKAKPAKKAENPAEVKEEVAAAVPEAAVVEEKPKKTAKKKEEATEEVKEEKAAAKKPAAKKPAAKKPVAKKPAAKKKEE